MTKPKVLQKYTKLETLFDNPEALDAWSRGRLERQAAHEHLKALASVVEDLTGKGIEQFTVPDDVVLRPLRDGEARLRLPSGEFGIVRPDDNQVIVTLPLRMVSYPFPVFMNTVDRSSINASGLHFLQHNEMMVGVDWDYYHGMWNAIKNSCKSASGGKVWRTVLEMLIAFNMNHGPFRSGQWYKCKQEWLALYMETHSVLSDEFQEVVHSIAKGFGMPSSSLQEQSEVFDAMASMRSFCEKGPVLKLQRWLSIQEVWEWYEPELHGFREIMRFANSSGALGSTADTLQREGTGTTAHAEVLNAMKKSGGTVAMIPDILVERNFRNMRIFMTVTMSSWKVYSHRAKFVKNPNDGFDFNLTMAKGGWQSELVDAVRSSLYSPDRLTYMEVESFGADDMSLLVNLLFQLLKNRAASLVCLSDTHPSRSILALDPDNDLANAARGDLLEDWHILLKCERLSLKHAGMAKVLNSVFWRRHSLVRMIFHLCESECDDPSAPALRRLLRGVHLHWPDSKVVEDMHQHLRDETRTQRASTSSRQKRMITCVDSKVIEKRGMKSVTVTGDEIGNAPSKLLKEPVKHRWRAAPKHWPKYLMNILMPNRRWPSPTPSGYTNAAGAWQWLREFWNGSMIGKTKIDATWRSRLIPCPALIRKVSTGQYKLVFLVSDFGCLAWAVEVLPDGAFKLVVHSMPIGWEFITDLADIEVFDFAPELRVGHGIVLRRNGADGQPQPLACAIIASGGARLTKTELAAICDDVGFRTDDLPSHHSQKDLLEALARFLFKHYDADQLAAMLENLLSAKPAPKNDFIADEQLADLLEEITVHDACNIGDINELKKNVKVIRAQTLSQLKADAKKSQQKSKNKRGIGNRVPLLRRRLARRRRPGAEVPEGSAAAAAAEAPEGDVQPAALEDAPPSEPPPAHADDGPPLAIVEQDASSVAPPSHARRPILFREPSRYTTPQILKALVPDMPSTSISLEEPACRWAGKLGGDRLPSVGFGPLSPFDRRQALEQMLDTMWAASGRPRPATAYVSAVAPHAWGGTLDPREERPRKYPRRS